MSIFFSKIFLLFFWFCKIHFILTLSNSFDEYINEFVVQCPSGYSEAKSVAIQMGFVLKHKMRGFDDYYVFKHKSYKNKDMQFHKHRLKRSPKVNWVEQQIKLKRVKRDMMPINKPPAFIDPLYKKQWYLIRSQFDPSAFDMNVKEAWELGYTGKGVVISILDDGIDYRHDDLRENYDPKASFDINGDDNDPLPNLKIAENRHGTRCAGEVSAKANNSKCGVGIAYNSKIGAVRMLDGDVTDRVEAEALSFKQQHIDIYSGSWGPDDNGQKVEGPSVLAKSAFEKGTKFGRNGLGNIYIWASGNGGKKMDSCACDGYASSIYTISISSVSERNVKPWYLESCASTLVSTYSSGDMNEQKIISTDLNNLCATDHTGTSASAPLAAGIVALVIEANRNLTWRDVQYITVATANPNPFVDGEFIINGANRKVSNLYGFGLMDTGKMVRLARLWHTLPPQHICKASYNGKAQKLKNKFTVRLSTKSDGCSGKNKINYVEHVVLYLTIEYQRRGDLRVHLISPSGTKSEILPYRPYDFSAGLTTFDIWPLMSVQFWGEKASGEWSVEIDNRRSKNLNYRGVWSKFELEIYGTEQWPMRLKSPGPNEDDKWFQQFERFVVENTKESFSTNSPVSLREHTDASQIEFTIGDFECDQECFNNTCSAPGPQFCDSCANYQTMSGLCVSKCEPGTYLDNSSKTCHNCHYSCDECLGPGQFNCTRCLSGDSYTADKKQCKILLQNCPRGFYKKLKTCEKCPKNCSVCISSSQCLECDKSFVLTIQSKCRPTCDIGSYSDSRRRCRVCHINCLSCTNGDESRCTSCSYGSFINSESNKYAVGKCVKKCPYGFFTNHTVGFCYRCHENCKTCTGPSSKMCTACIPPLELLESEHTCIDPVTYNCKPDEFKTNHGICKKCLPGCRTCSEEGCTSCLPNWYHFGKSCVNQCPSGYFLFNKLKSCLSCDEYCNSCNSSLVFTECGNCSRGLTSCHQNCTIGQYWNTTTKTCQKCHFTCGSCQGSSDQNCSTCIQHSHILSRGKCLEQCPKEEYAFNFTNQKICVPCHLSCKNLSCFPGDGKCMDCPYGHNLDSGGQCTRRITCSMPEFWGAEQNKCNKCDPSCRSCTQLGTCTSCFRNFCLDPYKSVCIACCDQYSNSKNCTKCEIGREFCMTEDSIIFPSTSLLIFRYPVTLIISITIVFILLFIVIILYFYSTDVIEFFKNSNVRNSKLSVRYKKLENFNDFQEFNEELDSSDDCINDKIQFKNQTIFNKSILFGVGDDGNSKNSLNIHKTISNGHIADKT